ncbi:MAG: S4 domain-containing protein [Nanoarchaeota archaeon]|nr:S4 domain-containing protein [Nanoarchaeota archaeon]
MHIKKTQMPNNWPVPRKGKRKRFLAVPSHATSKGISLLFLLRDVLKLVKTRKEAKYMTLNGMVKVNHQIRRDVNFPVQVFDTLNLSPRNDSADPEKVISDYRLEIVNKKFSLVKVSTKDAEKKVVKIIGKKILGIKKTQMNLDDGQNFLTKEKFSVGDSVVLNTKEKKIEKILPLKKGAKIEVIRGKHSGEKGELEGFKELARGRNYIIKLEDKIVSLPYKTILVVE